MSSTDARYIVISAVKNEAQYIGETLSSMAAQTVTPAEWVIVNDGSTDATPKVVKAYARKYSWMRLVDAEVSKRSRGGHIVKLVYYGLSKLKTRDFDFIVKLDGDLSFEPGFFERVFAHLGQNPALGITSGISHICSGGVLVEEKSARGHTLGACKVYRKECFEAIGGLVSAMGWDGIDEIKARMKGWEASPVPGLRVIHLRPEGQANGAFASGKERGRGSYFMGYHPLFFAVRATKNILKSPLDGVGMITGYLGAALKGAEKIDDPEFIRFIRKNQLRKLLMLKHKV
jgi:glycosyltransferase involved in cell wall biosynthesis